MEPSNESSSSVQQEQQPMEQQPLNQQQQLHQVKQEQGHELNDMETDPTDENSMSGTKSDNSDASDQDEPTASGSGAPETANDNTAMNDIAATAAALSAAMTAVSGSNAPAVDMNMNASPFHQLNAVQTQAIAQAAAVMASNGNNYHELFANFDSNTALAAAVAAAAASANNNTGTNPATAQPQVTAEMVKRELINQKVRADNRERKKRWREQNEERNKDNDLRCRVNKRAHKLFGREDSEHKRRWIEEEFLKRQSKRKEKERRKQVVNGAIAASESHHLGSVNHHPSSAGVDLSQAAAQFNARILGNNTADGNNNLLSREFLQLLLQSTASADLSAQALSSATAASTSSTMPSASDAEKLAAFLTSKIQSAADATHTDLAPKPKPIAEGVSSAEDLTKEKKEQQGEQGQQQQYPIDAVMTLMQLNAGWRQ